MGYPLLRLRRCLGLLALLLAIAVAPLVAGADTIAWKLIQSEDGIQVWQRPVPGSSLVAFRGRSVIPANIKQVLAVLQDNKRKTEWMENCVEDRLLEAHGVGKRVIYNRIGSPFPLISDRDVVVETALDAWPEKRRVRIDAWNVANPRAPEQPGVVRMPHLQLSYVLVALDGDRTELTYEVEADPGGSIPAWLVNLASKKLPFGTIAKLREQVKKDYAHELAIVEASYDWAAVGL